MTVSPPPRGHRLLVADSRSGTDRSLAECLAGLPFEIEQVTSLAEALERLAAGSFDAVAVDVGLPDGGGAKAVSTLRERASATAVVALVNVAERLSGVEAMQLGAEDYLVKEHFDPRLAELTLVTAVERRRTLLELERAEAQVRRQALFFESISDAILVADNDDRIVDCNGAAERTFGFTRQEMIGQTPSLLRAGLDHPSLRKEIVEAIDRDGRWFGEIPFVAKDGRTGINEVLVMPIRDEAGKFVGTFGANRDITERKRLEEQLRHAQALEAVGRLAGGVAHDFNNLLTTILGYCDVMMQDLAEGDPLRSSVREIRRAGERAAALTRQLLAFGRKQVFAAQLVDLNALVERTGDRLRAAAGGSVEVRLELDTARHLLVRVDEALLEQILLNLAANAVDAMPLGGVMVLATAAVRVEGEDSGPSGPRAGEYALLTFSDSGSGMDAETRRHLFEPFFTTKEKGAGRGLGLASVYGTVTQAGGHIDVSSSLGSGTTLRVFLPRVADRPSGEHELSLKKPNAPAEVPEPGGREVVLVVEDDEMVRRLVREVLSGRGYQVIEAASAEQALALLPTAQASVDLLLTDLFMSGASGIDLAQEFIRRSPRGRVILMSGYADEAALQGGMPGAAGFLQKPFTADQLVRRVRRALQSTGN